MDLEIEKELVEKAKKDPEAFSKLYEDNYSKIFGYVLNRVANVEIAQDITSETFFKSLKNIDYFKWKKISFSCWLYKIASNETANYFRKNKYKPICFDKIAEPASCSTPHEEAIEVEEQFKKQKDFLELREKVILLPDKYQKVITLKFFEKKKIEEICQILGKKEGTIKSLVHRGIEKLKENLNNETFH